MLRGRHSSGIPNPRPDIGPAKLRQSGAGQYRSTNQLLSPLGRFSPAPLSGKQVADGLGCEFLTFLFLFSVFGVVASTYDNVLQLLAARPLPHRDRVTVVKGQ